MKPFRPLSAVEQLAAHLREEILTGGLDGNMPGVAQLVRPGVETKAADGESGELEIACGGW